jgi:hypothetical protein
MAVKNNTKRSNNLEQLEVQVEGLDLSSDYCEELVRDKRMNKSSPINSTGSNLIPELDKFSISPSSTQPSPLLQDSRQQNSNIVNNIKQSPLVSNQARNHVYHSPIPFVTNYQYHPHPHPHKHSNNHRHRQSASVSCPSLRFIRPVRHQVLQFSAQERQELIESNLRKSEILRRKMQAIEYELFIISRNISKLQE